MVAIPQWNSSVVHAAGVRSSCVKIDGVLQIDFRQAIEIFAEASRFLIFWWMVRIHHGSPMHSKRRRPWASFFLLCKRPVAPQSALSALGRSAPCASLVEDPAVVAYPHDQLSIQRWLVGSPHDRPATLLWVARLLMPHDARKVTLRVWDPLV